jgi:hypothetical protein
LPHPKTIYIQRRTQSLDHNTNAAGRDVIRYTISKTALIVMFRLFISKSRSMNVTYAKRNLRRKFICRIIKTFIPERDLTYVTFLDVASPSYTNQDFLLTRRLIMVSTPPGTKDNLIIPKNSKIKACKL